MGICLIIIDTEPLVLMSNYYVKSSRDHFVPNWTRITLPIGVHVKSLQYVVAVTVHYNDPCGQYNDTILVFQLKFYNCKLINQNAK